jgi:hypothetical protein
MAIESILGQLQIQQVRAIDNNPYPNSPLIDQQFCLEKYSQLEQREENYD